jgi:Heparinase II/III-like protein/Heparinase II/III N-terminus
MNLDWYWRRLHRMGPAEVVWRLQDAVFRQLWRFQQDRPATRLAERSFVDVLNAVDRKCLPQKAAVRLIAAAEDVLEGRWRVFAKVHPALSADPDWFLDAHSGLHIPDDRYAFDISYRDESRRGNIKYIWEPSRHHHLTVLAAAYAITGDKRYAERVALHLQSWWSKNPFLRGPHWISGIELGIRLISWVWMRRLLATWSGAAGLFEDNPLFVSQLYHHQRWLAYFPSRGSSANNHLVAEAAGQFVASCAFQFFAESLMWRRQSARVLETEIVKQTFSGGLNRELATDYHGFVLELFLTAAVEGELSKQPLTGTVWERIRAMMDALAAIVDCECKAPRQGDGDDGIGLLLDGPDYNRWKALLSTGRRMFGQMPWWPHFEDEDVRTQLWACAIASPEITALRPAKRPNLFSDAGQAYLRTANGREEIWCRCDSGPHGFLSIAAHAHADALSVELRVGGVEVLVDPGTYCYHGNPEWRSYFRSTLAHNTLELFGRSQSVPAGPFLWMKSAQSRLISVDGLDELAPEAQWQAEHTGYTSIGGPVHRRIVVLKRAARIITIQDELLGDAGEFVQARLAFHLGPEIKCTLTSKKALLIWPDGDAELELPPGLSWRLHRGEKAPPLGWFSPSFDLKVPSFSLIGSGTMRVGSTIISRVLIRRSEHR